MNYGQVDFPYPVGKPQQILVPQGANAPPGYLGVFGLGLWQVFAVPGTYTFTVPAGVTRIRGRVVGAGGGTRLAGPSSGGGGAGYAHGEFPVTPGQTITVIVGAPGTTGGVIGGTSSLGSLLSATGGVSSQSAASAAGGIGVGGSFQAKGGSSGAANGSGGAAAGSQLGDGGGSLPAISGGGAPAGGIGNLGGGSPFGPPFTTSGAQNGGPDVLGISVESNTAGSDNPANMPIRFPFDGFTSGGGSGGTDPAFRGGRNGGGGGSGSNLGAAGGNAAGGGGGVNGGGVPGIGAGSGGITVTGGVKGGAGLVVIEF